MKSILVKELIKVTASGEEEKEVPITTTVSQNLKKGKKMFFARMKSRIKPYFLDISLMKEWI